MQYIGKPISLIDSRTGQVYDAIIADAKHVWGKLRFTVDGETWFEPTSSELKAVKS